MSDYLDPNNEELLKDFFVEAEMQLELLEQNILVLENDPGNEDSIDEIFRAAHTLKGASATVQMTELSEFTHIVEDVLDDIRSGKLAIDETITDTLLNSIDIIKAMLEARSQGSVYEEDISQTENALRSYLGGAKPAAAKTAKKPPKAEKKTPSSVPASSGSTQSLSEYDVLELQEAAEDDETVYQIIVEFNPDNPMNTVGGIQVFAALKSLGKVLKTSPDFEALYEDNFYPTVVYYLSTKEAADKIEPSLHISDVTVSSEVQELSKVSSEPVIERQESSEEQTEEEYNEYEEVAAPAPSSQPLAATASDPEDDSDHDGEIQEAIDAVKASIPGQSAAPKKNVEQKKVASSSILRVESKRIDDLLNLVSETVINKATFNQVSNQFTENLTELQHVQNQYRSLIKDLFDALPEYLEEIQKGASVKDIKRKMLDEFGQLSTFHDGFHASIKASIAKFRNTAQNLGRITSELQEGVMRIRMVPISQIFSRFPRLVRDLSKSLNKKVNLMIEGEDTELDKSVIEDLLDPLIHCVRNSLDHGIESPEERKKAGKAVEGTINLKASNEGNMILIEIFDDGKGIDVNKVKKKAIDRGVIHPSKVLTDIEAYNLIFEPGFSTAQQITNISGRGVGLDVVKKQIEKLNGNVSVWSAPGKGTRFTIKIPLTLAIIQGLLVRVGKEMYAIPITAVLDSHRIKPEEIRMIDNYEVFNVREDVVSLMRLNRIFNIPTEENKEHYFVVIVGSGDKKMGLIVDQLIGEEDVVIKPLRDHYTNAPGIAGANITGDGTVSLIIDVSQLLELGQKIEMEARQRREVKPRN
jgi:two-component system chemotaxis sensor kinase CheA